MNRGRGVNILVAQNSENRNNNRNLGTKITVLGIGTQKEHKSSYKKGTKKEHKASYK